MTETVFSAGKPSRPRHECFAALGKWRGGPQNHGLPGVGGKPSDLRRSTPKKQDSNFAFRRPFSQLGNPHVLGVSVLRNWEIGGGPRKMCPFLEGNRLKLSDFRGMTPENRTQFLHTGNHFLNWESLTPSA